MSVKNSVQRGMETFARRVQPDDLPEPVRKALAPYCPDDSTGKLVAIPPQRYIAEYDRWYNDVLIRWRQTPPRVLSFDEDALVVVNGNTVDTTRVQRIPFTDLLEITHVSELLYSFVELVWLDGERVERIKIEFNSVSSRLIEPGLKQARVWLSTYPDPVDQPDAPCDHFPYKFATFTRMSLLDGERPVMAVYEPAIRKSGKVRWGCHSPNRAILLTPQRLIIVEDARPGWWGNPYRMAQRYVPRGQVRRVSLEPQPDFTELHINLGGTYSGHELVLPLSEAQAGQVYAQIKAWMD
ncbi:MAG: hypothetical protein JXQ72_12450 [Anaerolineae bacterium]|nr:hypothetical protein [Anaerolineae bacterium]